MVDLIVDELEFQFCSVLIIQGNLIHPVVIIEIYYCSKLSVANKNIEQSFAASTLLHVPSFVYLDLRLQYLFIL